MAHPSILAYEEKLPSNLLAVVKALRGEIERLLPAATSKVWHSHPVWFDGDNPVVGYDARKEAVTILFWNGQALGEPGLQPVGKGRAAGQTFRTAADIDRAALRRCLEKARANVFDSVNYVRTLRDQAKRAKARTTPARGRATGEARSSARRVATPRRKATER
jgi:hypothetical protein